MNQEATHNNVLNSKKMTHIYNAWVLFRLDRLIEDKAAQGRQASTCMDNLPCGILCGLASNPGASI